MWLVEDITGPSTFITEVISTATAGITTLTAGVALVGLGTVTASSAFLALPVLLPAVLVGLVAASKLAHGSMLHRHSMRVRYPNNMKGCLVLGDVQTDPVTSVRNRELVTGLGLGGVTASAAVVGNHSLLYPGLGVAGGLSAGLAVAALGLTINAIHDAVFAWQRYHAIQIPTQGVEPVEQYNQHPGECEEVQVSKDDINLVKINKEIAGRAMYSSMVAALGWAAITTGSVAAAMSLAPIFMAASFLLGGVAITGARLYNDGFNFGLFNKRPPGNDLPIYSFETRIAIRSVLHSF